jgi:hypothetical protein
MFAMSVFLKLVDSFSKKNAEPPSEKNAQQFGSKSWRD